MASATGYRTREATTLRRAQIVDEAIRVIGEQGYNGFTLQGLAKRCNTTNAGLLYYFDSKAGLLLALLKELERREAEALIPLVDAAEQELPLTRAARSGIIRLLCAFFNRIVRQPELERFHLVLLYESMDPAHPAHEWFSGRQRLGLELIARLLSPWIDDPEQAARHLVALKDGLAQQWLREGGSFDVLGSWERAVTTLVPDIDPAANG